MPKDPIMNPMDASFPPSSLIYNGSRKKDEKLQKKRKFAAVASEKFLSWFLVRADIIFSTRIRTAAP